MAQKYIAFVITTKAKINCYCYVLRFYLITMAPHDDIATRVFIVALKSLVGGKSTAAVAAMTGVKPRIINNIYIRAIIRGFDPNSILIIIKDSHLEDSPKTSRPTKRTEALQETISTKVRRDRFSREISCTDLAGQISTNTTEISATTVYRTLKKLGFNKTKPTRKPGLTKKIRDNRLRWYLDYKDWTLNDWKNVIWSDKTSVVLNQKRGGYRIWRTADEAFVKNTIRERWKSYSEFMF